VKKLLLITVLFLASCQGLDWIAGVDADGNDLEGEAPISSLTKILGVLGPYGTAGGLGLTTLAAAYVSRKRNGTLTAVVEGVQKAKGSLSKEQLKVLHKELAKHIPEKYLSKIEKIKDAMD